LMIWKQNDWRLSDSFSMSCRHKRDLITGDETWSQGLFGFRLTQKNQSLSKRQLQTKSICWSFCGEFTRSHTIAGSKRSHIRFTILLWRSAESTRSENAAKFQANPQTLDFESYRRRKVSRGKGDPRVIECFPIQMHAAATV
jgi:hypothetical protein